MRHREINVEILLVFVNMENGKIAVKIATRDIANMGKRKVNVKIASHFSVYRNFHCFS